MQEKSDYLRNVDTLTAQLIDWMGQEMDEVIDEWAEDPASSRLDEEVLDLLGVVLMLIAARRSSLQPAFVRACEKATKRGYAGTHHFRIIRNVVVEIAAQAITRDEIRSALRGHKNGYLTRAEKD